MGTQKNRLIESVPPSTQNTCLIFSSFSIILLRIEIGGCITLIVLLLSCGVVFGVLGLFPMPVTVPWVGLQCVSVAFPGHTHLPFDHTSFSK